MRISDWSADVCSSDLSAITWKYPSCVLAGENSVGEFYSVALTNNYQQADTGTKMIHLGKNSRSTIISKGISAGKYKNTYRGLVRVAPTADNVRNFTLCDSLMLGDQCGRSAEHRSELQSLLHIPFLGFFFKTK